MPVNPSPEKLQDLAARSGDEPIVMLNLLRYRSRAESRYGVDGMSGEEAYREYGRRFAKLHPRFGGEAIWMGRPHDVVIGMEGEAWDLTILVRYPTREEFISMLADPEYQSISPIRTAALSDARLIEMSELLSQRDG